jgi:hypothetical protein
LRKGKDRWPIGLGPWTRQSKEAARQQRVDLAADIRHRLTRSKLTSVDDVSVRVDNRKKIGPKDHMILRDRASTMEDVDTRGVGSSAIEDLKLHRRRISNCFAIVKGRSDVGLSHLGMAEAIGRDRELHWHDGLLRLRRIVESSLDASIGPEHVGIHIGLDHVL